MNRSFHIFAMAALGKGLSGSDRIFIEFAKRLQKDYPLSIYVWEEGREMCRRQKLTRGVKLLSAKPWCGWGFVICYFARIIKSISFALTVKLENDSRTVVYSASEFWMDSLPAFILKKRFPKIRWIAAWFQTAPNPITGFTEGNRENTYRLSALFYWLMQLPIKPLIENYADGVLVNNDLEKKHFSKNSQTKIAVVLGAVNIDEIHDYQKKHNVSYLYDGVFQGRFHPQKGVLELVEIWKLVVKALPKAKLVMIGDGPLMKSVKIKVKSEKLENNIILTGYLFDGPGKYRIFSRSKIVLHPAFYDSGGMAAAEAMAFGLPGVGFDLASYQSYYPKGLIKVKIGDLPEFARVIVNLLKTKEQRDKVGKEAQKMIAENWNWEDRVHLLLDFL